jgi:hypothetical protein
MPIQNLGPTSQLASFMARDLQKDIANHIYKLPELKEICLQNGIAPFFGPFKEGLSEFKIYNESLP